MRHYLKSLIARIDPVLLCFLVLFTNQAMLSVKLGALALIYLVRPDFRFGLRKGRLPLFYLAIVLLSAVNLLAHVQDFSRGMLAAFTVGNLFWICCFLAHHQVKRAVERSAPERIDATLRLYAVLNLGCCVAQLLRMAAATRHWNPYDSDIPFPYGLSAGDHIYGLLLESSLFNIAISGMLCLYFLFRRNVPMAFVCAAAAALPFGNMVLVLFLLTLGAAVAVAVFFRYVVRNKMGGAALRISLPQPVLKWIPVLIAFIFSFYLIFSPNNVRYTVDKIASRFRTADEPLIVPEPEPQAGTDTIVKARRNPVPAAQGMVSISRLRALDAVPASDSAGFRRALDEKLRITDVYIAGLHGKSLALKETFAYLSASPMNFLFGAGTARFSSLTAARFGGLDSSRLFSRLPHYESVPFATNHRLIHVRRLVKAEYFSAINHPDSFVNQLLGEYGVLGALLFLLLYAGYFYRRRHRLSYGYFLALFVAMLACVSYLFEALCVMIFFELLMELDIRRQQNISEHVR